MKHVSSDSPASDEASSGTRRRFSLDRFERDVLEFVLRWAPYGGPRDEDTLPQFGMTCERLRERFRAIVRDFTKAGDAGADHALIDRAVRLLEAELQAARAVAAPAHAGAPGGLQPPRGAGWRMVRGVWRRA